MTSDSYMARFGERLVDNGYSILPIIPGTKAPGQIRRGEWHGYPDWSRHCDRPTKPFELGIWSKWPGAGIGFPCGPIVALDIDVMDADAVAKIEALARSRLGDTPAIRIGYLPKRLLVYRAEQPFAGIKHHPLEILGRGSQFVGYADHPDTGKPYYWPNESLIDLPISSLPSITEAQARSFLAEAAELVPFEHRRKRLGDPRSAEHFYGSGGDLVGTVEGVSAALEWIPNDDLVWDDWIKIGLAIKGAIGEAGAPLWSDWSRKASKSGSSGKSDTPEREWRGFKPHSIGAGTIYRYAMDHGWIPEAGTILNGAEAARVEQPHPAEALLKKANGHAKPADPIEPPPRKQPPPPSLDFVHRAPGLLGVMVRWITATSVSPQPFLALGASLAALGALMGQKYRLDCPDTRSNVYIISLADSGAGKDHPRRCIRRVLMEAGLTDYLGGEQIKSGSGLMTSVADQPCILYQIDEFGHFVKAALDRNRAGYHLQEIMTNFTTLWSSATELVRGAEYANKKERPRRDIIEPCVCLYGSTVPITFWNALQSGNVGDGSLARFLVFLSPENYPDERDPEPITAGLAEVVSGCAAVAAGRPSAGNLIGTGAITPYVVPLSGETLEADRSLRDDHLAMKRKHQGTAYSAIVARFREHVRRVALIAAVADAPADPVCTPAHLAWAEDLVRHCQATVVDQVDRYIADSEYEAQQKKVLEVIRRHGDWMSGNELAQRVRFIKSRERGDILNHLIEAGLLEVQTLKTAGRSLQLVKAAQ